MGREPPLWFLAMMGSDSSPWVRLGVGAPSVPAAQTHSLVSSLPLQPLVLGLWGNPKPDELVNTSEHALLTSYYAFQHVTPPCPHGPTQ